MTEKRREARRAHKKRRLARRRARKLGLQIPVYVPVSKGGRPPLHHNHIKLWLKEYARRCRREDGVPSREEIHAMASMRRLAREAEREAKRAAKPTPEEMRERKLERYRQYRRKFRRQHRDRVLEQDRQRNLLLTAAMAFLRERNLLPPFERGKAWNRKAAALAYVRQMGLLP